VAGKPKLDVHQSILLVNKQLYNEGKDLIWENTTTVRILATDRYCQVDHGEVFVTVLNHGCHIDLVTDRYLMKQALHCHNIDLELEWRVDCYPHRAAAAVAQVVDWIRESARPGVQHRLRMK
jgi:hypothetical protein